MLVYVFFGPVIDGRPVFEPLRRMCARRFRGIAARHIRGMVLLRGKLALSQPLLEFPPHVRKAIDNLKDDKRCKQDLSDRIFCLVDVKDKSKMSTFGDHFRAEDPSSLLTEAKSTFKAYAVNMAAGHLPCPEVEIEYCSLWTGLKKWMWYLSEKGDAIFHVLGTAPLEDVGELQGGEPGVKYTLWEGVQNPRLGVSLKKGQVIEVDLRRHPISCPDANGGHPTRQQQIKRDHLGPRNKMLATVEGSIVPRIQQDRLDKPIAGGFLSVRLYPEDLYPHDSPRYAGRWLLHLQSDLDSLGVVANVEKQLKEVYKDTPRVITVEPGERDGVSWERANGDESSQEYRSRIRIDLDTLPPLSVVVGTIPARRRDANPTLASTWSAASPSNPKQKADLFLQIQLVRAETCNDGSAPLVYFLPCNRDDIRTSFENVKLSNFVDSADKKSRHTPPALYKLEVGLVYSVLAKGKKQYFPIEIPKKYQGNEVKSPTFTLAVEARMPQLLEVSRTMPSGQPQNVEQLDNNGKALLWFTIRVWDSSRGRKFLCSREQVLPYLEQLRLESDNPKLDAGVCLAKAQFHIEQNMGVRLELPVELSYTTDEAGMRPSATAVLTFLDELQPPLTLSGAQQSVLFATGEPDRTVVMSAVDTFENGTAPPNITVTLCDCKGFPVDPPSDIRWTAALNFNLVSPTATDFNFPQLQQAATQSTTVFKVPEVGPIMGLPPTGGRVMVSAQLFDAEMKPMQRTVLGPIRSCRTKTRQSALECKHLPLSVSPSQSLAVKLIIWQDMPIGEAGALPPENSCVALRDGSEVIVIDSNSEEHEGTRPFNKQEINLAHHRGGAETGATLIGREDGSDLVLFLQVVLDGDRSLQAPEMEGYLSHQGGQPSRLDMCWSPTNEAYVVQGLTVSPPHTGRRLEMSLANRKLVDIPVVIASVAWRLRMVADAPAPVQIGRSLSHLRLQPELQPEHAFGSTLWDYSTAISILGAPSSVEIREVSGRLPLAFKLCGPINEEEVNVDFQGHLLDRPEEHLSRKHQSYSFELLAVAGEGLPLGTRAVVDAGPAGRCELELKASVPHALRLATPAELPDTLSTLCHLGSCRLHVLDCYGNHCLITPSDLSTSELRVTVAARDSTAHGPPLLECFFQGDQLERFGDGSLKLPPMWKVVDYEGPCKIEISMYGLGADLALQGPVMATIHRSSRVIGVEWLETPAVMELQAGDEFQASFRYQLEDGSDAAQALYDNTGVELVPCTAAAATEPNGRYNLQASILFEPSTSVAHVRATLEQAGQCFVCLTLEDPRSEVAAALSNCLESTSQEFNSLFRLMVKPSIPSHLAIRPGLALHATNDGDTLVKACSTSARNATEEFVAVHVLDRFSNLIVNSDGMTVSAELGLCAGPVAAAVPALVDDGRVGVSVERGVATFDNLRIEPLSGAVEDGNGDCQCTISFLLATDHLPDIAPVEVPLQFRDQAGPSNEIRRLRDAKGAAETEQAAAAEAKAQAETHLEELTHRMVQLRSKMQAEVDTANIPEVRTALSGILQGEPGSFQQHLDTAKIHLERIVPKPKWFVEVKLKTDSDVEALQHLQTLGGHEGVYGIPAHLLYVDPPIGMDPDTARKLAKAVLLAFSRHLTRMIVVADRPAEEAVDKLGTSVGIMQLTPMWRSPKKEKVAWRNGSPRLLREILKVQTEQNATTCNKLLADLPARIFRNTVWMDDVASARAYQLSKNPPTSRILTPTHILDAGHGAKWPLDKDAISSNYTLSVLNSVAAEEAFQLKADEVTVAKLQQDGQTLLQLAAEHQEATAAVEDSRLRDGAAAAALRDADAELEEAECGSQPRPAKRMRTRQPND
mmetsp:Transcript_32503/g.92130  ORF Transcript_32503/g.92130 Transcript_32503/m.92130 type:complete len:1838 (-) Transcript_32503:177-5690(-)